MRALTTTQRFAAVALACAAALALALLAQYGFAKQPCPWCILQRLIFIAIGALALLGALLGARLARIVCAALVLAFALLGAAAAQWQNAVAAKSSSCNLTLADKVLNALDVEALMPTLFKVTANCADAEVRVFGVAFEHWSLALYLVLAFVATSILLKLRRGV
ncbi:MAG: disulfide bond formation protein B [Burkholderiales bacterium]|nr:disulfide bond formation protein B [Burkholderiales bacterium]